MGTLFCLTIWLLFLYFWIDLKNAVHSDKALLRSSFNTFSDGRRHGKHVFRYRIPASREHVVARLNYPIWFVGNRDTTGLNESMTGRQDGANSSNLSHSPCLLSGLLDVELFTVGSGTESKGSVGMRLWRSLLSRWKGSSSICRRWALVKIALVKAILLFRLHLLLRCWAVGPPFLLYILVRSLYLKTLSLFPAVHSPTESQTFSLWFM